MYFAGYEGDLFAVGTDGTLKWVLKDVSGSIAGGPTLAGDLLAFGTTDGRLYIVKKSDHTPAPGWPKDGLKFGNGIWAAPIIKGDVVIVATMSGEVSAFNVKDGSRAWGGKSFRASGAVPDLQLLDDSHIFAPSLNKHVYILNAADGSVAADFQAADWVWTRAAFRDNTAYFGDFSGKVYALDITTGTNRWPQPYDTHQKVKAAPAIVDDALVVVDRKPVVHLIDLKAGTALNTVPLLNSGTVRADVLPFSSALKTAQSATSPSSGADRGLIVTTGGKLFVANPKEKTVIEVVVAGGKQ
jgi:outer membrane protein assembly factor BamB